MAGQGSITRAVAKTLSSCGWTILYTCIPNTAHANVIPIPVATGSCKQRYPDVFAFNDRFTKLVEVEITLNAQVAADLLTRFGEYVSALRHPLAWGTFRSHAQTTVGMTLPQKFEPQCDLVICKGGVPDPSIVADLNKNGIRVCSSRTYAP